MNIRNTPRSQNGMLHSVRFTELFVKNNSRQRMNFPSENSTIISAYAHSAQTYEALPVSMIRRAGLIQKLRSFSCNAIFQFFNVYALFTSRAASPFCSDAPLIRMFISFYSIFVTIESCKSLLEDVRKSQQSSCLTKMLTRRHKKSQQSSCFTKMLTRRHKKSQQSSCLSKMLTRRNKKSQQNSCLSKMLTCRHKKSQQNSCLSKMLTCRHKKSQQSSCLSKMLT